MGSFCPCWFPKVKKNIAYDVHEQTFQLDEQVGDLDHPKTQDHRQILTNAASDMVIADINILKKNFDDEEQNQFVKSKTKQDHHQPILQPKDKDQKNNYQPLKEQKNNQLLVDSPKYQLLSSQHQQNNQKQYPNMEQQPNSHILQSPPIQNKLQTKPKKNKPNLDDYRFINETSSFRIKKIDSIKQQQFNIDNCHNCTYFIFDITANLYIDDSSNCTIFVAPCTSTIFVRSSTKIKLIAATQQFRTYNIKDCQFSLFCQSQPVIQSSNNITFTSFDCRSYHQLQSQFQKANLSIWNNHWSQIHDFTKKEEINFTLKRQCSFIHEMKWEEAFTQAQLQVQLLQYPFIEGDFNPQHAEKYSNTSIITLNKQKSKQIYSLADIFQGKNIDKVRILKGYYNKNKNSKEQKLSLLINYDDDDLLDDVYSFADVLTEENQVKEGIKKYFISFGDERSS